MKRRILAILMITILTMTIIGCGKEVDTNTTVESATETTTESVPETAAETDTEETVVGDVTTEESAPETEVAEETPAPEATPEPAAEPDPTEAPAEEKDAYTYTDVSAVMYAKQTVNVRSTPSTDGSKMGSLSFAEEVTVTGKCNETGWYRIEYGGEVAYVSDKYLVDNKPVATPAPTVAPAPATAPESTPVETPVANGTPAEQTPANNTPTTGSTGTTATTPATGATPPSGGTPSGNGNTTCTHPSCSQGWWVVDKVTVGACWTEYADYKAWCDICGATLIEKFHEPYGCSHNSVVIQNPKTATCTEDGYGGIATCDCGENYRDDSAHIYPAHGHTPQGKKYTGETNAEGTLAYWYNICTSCNTILEEGWD